MKRILTTATFSICSLLTTFAQFSGPGSGTKGDPYIIMSADQLYSVRNFLNNTDVYFSIICDIDLTEYAYGAGWEPIGNDSSPFKGTIDGNGFKITGLEIKKSTKDYVGLFGCTYAAIIKNITVEGNVSGNNFVGGIAGASKSSKYNVEYENVHFNGNISGNNYVGGIAGDDSPNDGYTSTGPGIEYNKCGFSGTLSGNNYVGGIVGDACSDITYASVDATITANEYVGGISGDMRNLIKNCYVSVNISATSGFVGGVSGNGTGGDIKECSVNGKIVSSGDMVGGLIGYATCFSGQRHDFYISDSYFMGYLKANDYVGGIIGYNGGDVWHDTKNYKYWGYVIVQNNYVKGTIVGHDKVGGILSGYTSKNNPIIQSNVCICTRISSETENVGRIQARRDGATPNSCYSIYSTKVCVAGVNIQEEDILANTSLHGTDIGENNLKTALFYQGLSWDFASTWGIVDTESFPYLQTQAAPPIIQSSLASGETTITGNSFDGGNVKIVVDGSEYSTSTNNNKWSVTVSELQSGTKVVARAETDNLFPSYDVECDVAYLGEGTQESPYLVKTYSDLKKMHGSGYYKLDNDIDLKNSLNEESPFEGWYPLGVYSEAITNFDGGNHKISNLFISRDGDLVGLFSSLTDATVKNLTIEVADAKCVEGKEKVGILAGRLNNCTIDNVTIKGTVNGEKIVGGLAGQINGGYVNNVIISESSIVGKNYVGGIAGTSSAIVTLCSFDGRVSDLVAEKDGFDNSVVVYVGGLTAVSKGTISESKVEGNVTANRSGSKVGGLVSDNYSAIQNSYCTANVNGGTYAAGIAATNYSIVEYCYASGNITTTDTGTQTVSCGLIAYNNGADAVVSNCTAMNRNIISLSDVGNVFRVIGGITNGASIPGNRNYTLYSMVLSVNGIRQSVTDNPFNGYVKDDECFTTQSFYTDNGWDFASVWGMSEDSNYPKLQALSSGNTGGGDTPGGGDEPQTESLSASNVKLMTGKQQEVSIALNNESEIIMIEFEMQLPSGISIAKDENDEFLTELVSSRVAKSHTLEVADQGNGKYKFLLYSSSNAPLKGNSGDLITFTINCDKNATEGNYQAKVSSILMADKNEKAIYPNDFTFDITIVDAIPGDVNDDGKINGLDIVKIVGYIMGSPTQPFIEAAADLNEDGIINGLDLVKEVSLVLTQSSTTTAGAKTIGKRGQVSASQIALENPKHGVLTLSTDDNRDYILSQMIIETSGDVTVNSITTDAKHIVAYSKVGENRYAVVCYSMTNESFVSNRDIIDIHYTGNGYINLSNVLFVDSEENDVSLGRTSFSDTTAIKEINSTVKPADVYSVTGKLVKKGAISFEGLPAGIYIVNGQKIIIK